MVQSDDSRIEMGIRVKVKELRIEQSMKYEVITYFIIVTRKSRSNTTKYDIDNSKITSLCFTNYASISISVSIY